MIICVHLYYSTLSYPGYIIVKHLLKQLKPLALMPKLIRFESENVSLFTCASDELSKSYSQ